MYASAMAAAVMSAAGVVSFSRLINRLISWIRWNVLRCTAAFSVAMRSRSCKAYQYLAVAVGRSLNMPVVLSTERFQA